MAMIRKSEAVAAALAYCQQLREKGMATVTRDEIMKTSNPSHTKDILSGVESSRLGSFTLYSVASILNKYKALEEFRCLALR